MSELDLRGLKCPLPALHTARHLKVLAPGARLSVVADDPMAAIDIPHLCRQNVRLVSTTREGRTIRFEIEIEIEIDDADAVDV